MMTASGNGKSVRGWLQRQRSQSEIGGATAEMFSDADDLVRSGGKLFLDEPSQIEISNVDLLPVSGHHSFEFLI